MGDPKKLGVAAVVVLVAVAIALFAGRIWGSSAAQPEVAAAEQRAERAEAELAEARASHDQEITEARRSLSASARRVGLLEARRQVALAIDELDQRNFGLARRHCQRAAETLGALEPGADEELDALTEALRSFQFELDGQFEDSRRALREHAATLDRAVTPDTSDGAPASDA